MIHLAGEDCAIPIVGRHFNHGVINGFIIPFEKCLTQGESDEISPEIFERRQSVIPHFALCSTGYTLKASFMETLSRLISSSINRTIYDSLISLKPLWNLNRRANTPGQHTTSPLLPGISFHPYRLHENRLSPHSVVGSCINDLHTFPIFSESDIIRSSYLHWLLA